MSVYTCIYIHHIYIYDVYTYYVCLCWFLVALLGLRAHKASWKLSFTETVSHQDAAGQTVQARPSAALGLQRGSDVVPLFGQDRLF